MDIILLTSIIATLFVVFFIAIYRELSNVDEDSYKHQKDGGPRSNMVNFVGNLLEDKSMGNKEKKKLNKVIRRTIADMESNGMYFPDEVKEELKRQREELHCEYSGLPSIKAYEE